LGFGIWDWLWELEIGNGWDLELGIWDLTTDGQRFPRVSETDIAARAFSYYCERGFQHGADLEDWLRAERELSPAPKASARARR
jgi:Protein of unknown function (DUF2934)